MPRPCHAEHLPSPDTCTACARCAEDSARGRALRRLWGESEPTGGGTPDRGGPGLARLRELAARPCRHLGPASGDRARCDGCGAAHRDAAVHACAVHGLCTTERPASLPVDGSPARRKLACCAGCPDRNPADPPPPVRTRDCLYHVYPLRSAGPAWRRCLALLLSRAHLFNGKRFLACCTGPAGSGLESPAVVRALVGRAGFEVVEVANDPALREAKTLPLLLERVESDDPTRALFFGHAKGVTRPWNRGVTCHPWAWLCHEVMLDYWGAVERQLSLYPLTGAFKKVGRGFTGSESRWHYSGSFFWARSAALFSRDWRGIDPHWWGVESYPSLHFTEAEAGCLFHQGKVPSLNLYDMNYFRGVLAEYAWWRAENDHLRTAPCATPCAATQTLSEV